MRTVVLVPALAWRCPCGQQNVHHGSTKIPEEDKIAAAEDYREQGIDVDPEDLRCVPEYVWCIKCGEQFLVELLDEEV